ncbi:hypothetical protein [Nocardia sp. NBC_01327]|uniref:hypothetical protein n=1 Tax=Nocardia sp. NBC_01327 TaxID=2903593 RepID=UPI002E16119E|nr:hypothetical protein OG326_23975 [Nocardia sp. NBC_01327]
MRELLSAMAGNWDRTDPYVQVLRCAWVLARLDDWFTPAAITTLHLVGDGSESIAYSETGATVLESLDLDLGLANRQGLIDRIAAELHGDTAYAEAVDRLAVCVSAVHRAMADGTSPDESLDALSEAKHDYELRYEQVESVDRGVS